MSRECDVCHQEYNGEGMGYELREDKGKLIEKKFGCPDCIRPLRDKIRDKLNKEKIKHGKREK